MVNACMSYILYVNLSWIMEQEHTSTISPICTDSQITQSSEAFIVLSRLKVHYQKAKDRQSLINTMMLAFPKELSNCVSALRMFLDSNIGLATLKETLRQSVGDVGTSRFFDIINSPTFTSIYDDSREKGNQTPLQTSSHVQSSEVERSPLENALIKIFQQNQVKFTAQLIQTLAKKEDIEGLMKNMEQDLTHRQYKKLLNVLKSEELKQCLDKHSESKAIEANLSVQPQSQTPGPQNISSPTPAHSQNEVKLQFEPNVLDQKQLQRYERKQKSQRIFDLIKEESQVDINLCEKLVAVMVEMGDYSLEMSALEEEIPMKKFNSLKSVIQSEKVQRILQPQKQNAKNQEGELEKKLIQQQQKLRNIFREAGVKQDLNELSRALIRGQSTQEIMEKFEQTLPTKPYKLILKTLQAQQFNELIRQTEQIKEDLRAQRSKLSETSMKESIVREEAKKVDEFLKNSQAKLMDVLKKGGLKGDFSELCRVLIEGEDAVKIMEEFEETLPAKVYNNLQKILGEQEVAKTIRQAEKQRNRLKNLQSSGISESQRRQKEVKAKLRTMFLNGGLKQTVDIEKLLEKLVRKEPIDDLIDEYAEQLPKKQFSLLQSASNSNQCKQILTQLDIKGQKQLEESLAVSVREIFDQTDLNHNFGQTISAIVNNDERALEIQLKLMEDTLTKKEADKVLKAIEKAKKVKEESLNESRISNKSNKEVKRQSLRKLFAQGQVLQNVESLIDSLIDGVSKSDSLAAHEESMTIGELKRVEKVLNSEQMSRLIQSFGKGESGENANEVKINEVKIKIKDLFGKLEIKSDLTGLVDSIIERQDLTPQLDALQAHLTVSAEKKLKQLLDSQQLLELRNELQRLKNSSTNRDHTEQNIREVQAFFIKQKHNGDLSALIKALALEQPIEPVMKKFEQFLPLGQMKKIQQSVNSPQLRLILQRIRGSDNSGHSKNLQKKLSKLISEKKVPLGKYQKKFIELATQGKQLQQLFQELEESVPKKDFRVIEQFIKSKEYKQLFDQQEEPAKDERKQALEKLFLQKGLSKDLSKLIDAMLKEEDINPIVTELESHMLGKEMKIIQLVIECEQTKKILNSGSANTAEEKQRTKAKRGMTTLLKKVVPTFNFEQLINAKIEGTDEQQWVKQMEEELTGKQIKQVKEMVESNQFQTLLSKTTTKPALTFTLNDCPEDYKSVKQLAMACQTVLERRELEKVKIFDLERIANYALVDHQRQNLVKKINSLKQKPDFVAIFELVPIDFEAKEEINKKLQKIVEFTKKLVGDSSVSEVDAKTKRIISEYASWTPIQQLDALEFQKKCWSERIKIINGAENKLMMLGVNGIFELVIWKKKQQVERTLKEMLNNSWARVPQFYKEKEINAPQILKLRREIATQSTQNLKKELHGHLAFIQKYYRLKMQLEYLKNKFGCSTQQQKLKRFTGILENAGLTWQGVVDKQFQQPIMDFTVPDIKEICKSVLAYFSYSAIDDFCSNNKALLEALMTTVYINDSPTIKIIFDQKVTGNTIIQSLLKKKLLSESSSKNKAPNLFFTDKNAKKFYVCSLQVQLGQITELFVYETCIIPIKKNNLIKQVAVSKKLPIDLLNVVATTSLSNEKVSFIPCAEFVNIMDIEAQFGGQKNIILSQSIHMTETIALNEVKRLELYFYGEFRVYYELQTLKISMPLRKTCKDLKTKIFQITKIPIQSQIVLYCPSNKQFEVDNEQVFETFQSNQFHFKLVCQINLDHYGFNQNYRIEYHEFRDYFIEAKQSMEEMVEECQLGKESEEAFFRRLIKFMFSAVKKKFTFDHVIEDVRTRVYNKNNQTIWGGKQLDFNPTFILYYILMNCDERLKAEIINIMCTSTPIPILLRKFTNINAVTKEWVLNEELIWFLHETFTIASVGIHNQPEKQKGKTQLFNELVGTNFELSDKKHPIAQGCPEILLRFLEDKVPLNLIDISSTTPTEYTEKIIENVDFLIIHSWKTRQQSEKLIKEWKAKYKFKGFLCLLRDRQRQDNMNKLGQQIKQNQSIQYISLQNLKGKSENKMFMTPLRQFFWSAVQTAYDIKQPCSKLYRIYGNLTFAGFEELLIKIQPNLSTMIQVTPQMTIIKHQQKIHNQESAQQVAKLKQKVISRGLNQIVRNIIQFMAKNRKYAEFLLLRLRVTVRDIKEKNERPYDIILNVKKQLTKELDLKKEVVDQNMKSFLKGAEKQINALKLVSKVDLSHNQISKCIQAVNGAYHEYINDVKPSLFSIELFWRDLQYLAMLNDKEELLDVITDLKKRDIDVNQPFEVLDGDLLEMPRKFMKKVFDGKEDRVAVISVFGPQSSGKSTLLNFLYGCDFGVSAGRCTKGAYGTYFKFSNMKFKHCDGIFVIDTEGLFALLTAKEDKNSLKKQFDAKLVLFCLAVSDFVITNTKGNFDGQTKKILKTSRERFDKLSSGNMPPPELLLVLNQLQGTADDSIGADIHQNQELIPAQNVKLLAQAYKLSEISSQTVKLLKQGEVITKRQSRKEFLKKCLQIVDSLMQKIKQKDSFRTINQVIDQLEKAWNTIDAFPNLGYNKSKQVIDKEKQMKDWLIDNLQKLNKQKDLLYERLYQGNQKPQLLIKLLLSCKQKIEADFTDKFEIQDGKTNELVSRIELQKVKIQRALQFIIYEFKYQLQDLQKKRLVDKFKQQGSDTIEQLIRQIDMEQQNTGKYLDLNQKKARFDAVYENILLETKKNIDVDTQVLSYYERIKDFYQNAMKSSQSGKDTGTGIGLPKSEWTCVLQNSQSQFAEGMKNDMVETKFRDDKKHFFEYRQSRTVTKIVSSEGRYDAKLKYFNMSKYFSKKKTEIYYLVQEYHLKESLKVTAIQDFVKDQLKKEDTPAYAKVFEALNDCFIDTIGYKMSELQNFKETYHQKNKWTTFLDTQKFIDLIPCKTRTYKKKNDSLQQDQIEKMEDEPDLIKCTNIGEKFVDIKELIRVNEESCNQQSKKSSWHCTTSHYNGGMKKTYEGKDSKSKWVVKREEYFEKRKKDWQLISFVDHEDKHSSKNQIYILQNLQRKVTKLIKWSDVSKYVENESKMQNRIVQISAQIGKKLNEDSRKFGIQIRCADFYSYFMEKEGGFWNSSSKVKQIDFIRSFQNVRKFSSIKQLEHEMYQMVYLRGEYLANHMKSVQNSPSPQKYALGYTEQQSIQVATQYAGNHHLRTYLDNNHNQTFFAALSTDHLQNFVFKQLKKSDSFSKIFQKVDEYVRMASQNLSFKTIQRIFVDVSCQITDFNDDLNQVSYKLTLFFTGYLHLYAVYMIWKKFAEKLKEEKNKPFKELSNQSTRKKNFQYLCLRTSKEQKDVVKGQVQKFTEEFLKILKGQIEHKKNNAVDKYTSLYKQTYNRQQIQQNIDRKLFDQSNQSNENILQQLYQYLTDPKTIIEQQYLVRTEAMAKKLEDDIKNLNYVQPLIKQFKEFLNLFKKQLEESEIDQEAPLSKFITFEALSPQASLLKPEIQSEAKEYLMAIFLDTILQEPTKEQQEANYRFTPVNNFKFARSVQPTLQFTLTVLKKQIKTKKLQISNILKFINVFLSLKAESSEMIMGEQGVEVPKVMTHIDILTYEATKLEAQSVKQVSQFKHNVNVSVCKQKCPGCQRICGVEKENHTDEHQCLYGHQMRALGGVKLSNGEASVVRCENITKISQIKFNGDDISWQQFQEYWGKKSPGSWKFDDLEIKKDPESQKIYKERQDMFRTAWDLAGKEFCMKNQMTFVPFKMLEQQTTASNTGPIHYIFVLDDSSSMSGSSWKSLMAAFSSAVATIKALPNSQTLMRVTVLLLGSTCMVSQQDKAPSQVITSINPRYGGTDFASSFQKAYEIMSQVVTKQTIKFIFMTDGGCSFPATQVAKIKALQLSNPKKIHYYGIEFCNSGDTMKKICTELKGQNSISYDQASLTKSYVQIINRKVD